LKVDQHPNLGDLLLATGDEIIIEDCTSRQHGSGLFWGAGKQPDGSWNGDNVLGKLWMTLRNELKGDA
ncbi:NADAR family protein, partial [Parvimonas sp. D9]|uniref:NADAR family protein n=1 Tax=Parvimonas sp. D9 TaxID=3110689 RepID=UPI002B47223F